MEPIFSLGQHHRHKVTALRKAEVLEQDPTVGSAVDTDWLGSDNLECRELKVAPYLPSPLTSGLKQEAVTMVPRCSQENKIANSRNSAS